MTCNGITGGNYGDYSSKPIRLDFGTGKVNNTESTNKSSGVGRIDFTNTPDSVGRTDLDLVNPYAACGLNLSNKAPITSADKYLEVAQQSAPELNRWHGNYTLNNPEQAYEDLGAARLVMTGIVQDKYIRPGMEASISASMDRILS